LARFWLGLSLSVVFFSVLGRRPVRRAGSAILDLRRANHRAFYVVDTLLGGFDTFKSSCPNLALPAATRFPSMAADL